MSIIYVSYANKKYAAIQQAQAKRIHDLDIFDDIHAYREWDIPKSIWEENADILNQERGGGYWLWKPYILIKSLARVRPGDILLYFDCGDRLSYESRDIYNFIQERMDQEGMDVWLTKGAYFNREWTKKDCFVLMGCDHEKYHDAIQVEAGIVIVRHTEAARKFLTEWFLYCCVPQIITDLPNQCGLPNHIDFKDHRHDQSVLTNLAVRHNIYTSNEIRPYIYCNAYAPETF